MLNFTSGTGEYTDWCIEETDVDLLHQGKCESIFCQGSGVLGLRAAFEEAYAGRTPGLFLAGTYNKAGPGEVTELPNLPDVTEIRLTVDGLPFAMDRGQVSGYRRVLNLKTGELRRTLHWTHPEGHRLELEFSRFVSRVNPRLIGFRVLVRSLDGPVTLGVESGINARVTNTGAQHFGEGDKRIFEESIVQMRAITTESGVVCGLHAAHTFALQGEPMHLPLEPVIERRYLAQRCETWLEAGQTLTISKLVVVTTARDKAYRNLTPDVAGQAALRDGRILLEQALGQGYGELLHQSQLAWAGFWQNADITLQSERPFDQLALRFAQYHLQIMTNREDSRVGIAAKGLSGEGYKGHSFWDTEIFLLPYFALTDPGAARTLLEYRYLGLPGARKKAAENGYAGAMYPWEAAWVEDGEVTPRFGGANVLTGEPAEILTGQLEQHITADIAYAVAQYHAITGDEDFMDQYGYEMLIDTGRFWASRATWDKKKQAFVLLDVIGPDEYKEHVNNNAYTNYMAHHNLGLALWALDLLEDRQDGVFQRLLQQFDFPALRASISRVREALYLPQPDGDGILPQFDGYGELAYLDLSKYKSQDRVGSVYQDYRHDQLSGLQVAKQADTAVLMLLLEDVLPGEERRQNFEFYEARTLHDSSLSKSTASVLASDLGLPEVAYALFAGACNTDLGPDPASSDAGIHGAAMGGLWQCAVYGFGGVRVVGGTLRLLPHLPQGVQSLSFPLIFRGQPLRVRVTPEEVQVENHGEQPVEVLLAEGLVELAPLPAR